MGEKNRALEELRAALVGTRTHTIERGKAAFDQASAAGALKEAERLVKVARAEELVAELEPLLDALGIVIQFTPPEDLPRSAGAVGGRGVRLPEVALHVKELSEPVLVAIQKAGGTAHLRDIWKGVELQIKDRLRPVDIERMENHDEPRWMYNVRWTLTHLKKQGKVEKTGIRGVWRLL